VVGARRCAGWWRREAVIGTCPAAAPDKGKKGIDSGTDATYDRLAAVPAI
ncbi:unnamed protein product, partial [Oikopleura dioica]